MMTDVVVFQKSDAEFIAPYVRACREQGIIRAITHHSPLDPGNYPLGRSTYSFTPATASPLSKNAVGQGSSEVILVLVGIYLIVKPHRRLAEVFGFDP